MKRSRWIIVGGLLGLAACIKTTTIHGVTPISPRADRRWTVVESLRPTFRWVPVADANARYDFVIFESYGLPGPREVVGREVYYREGLQQPEHTLEISLQPDRKYFWSVRVRRGMEVSAWSRFDRFVMGCTVGTTEYPFFLFRTPSE